MTTTVGWILIITSILPVCSGCSAGLSGPSCREQNVALSRSTSQSSNYNNTLYLSGNAVDGKTGHNLDSLAPCTHTAVGSSQPYWTVTLNESYWIYRFTIYNRNGGCNGKKCGARLNGFTVSVRNSSGAYTTCYQDTTNNATGPGDVISEHCVHPLQGNTVKISLSSALPLTLCEVLIYAISGQCPEGWSGPSCKEENVALNRSTNQSSNYNNMLYPSGNAVDGKTGHNLESTPCTHTAVGSRQPWWTVTLNESYWIYRFTIYNRNGSCNGKMCGARLNGFTLSVETSSGANTTCYQDATNRIDGPGDVINEHCTSPVQGNTVKISLSSDLPLTLCEVLVYANSGQCPEGWDGPSCKRENVALRRSTTQSSNYSNTLYLSGNAVDGKTGHNLDSTPCTHTASGSSQYWTVTLNKSYWLDRFIIYNRKGGCESSTKCGARLNGFTVSVGTSAGANTTCYRDTTNSADGPGDVINEHCTSPVQGNTVTISLSSDLPLTLCEVLIYVCADGWYGEMCDKQCVSSTACLRCDRTGKRCDACQANKWGVDCQSSCGHCYKGSSCDKASGECPLSAGNPRCSSGYNGTRCDNECLAGKWGADCGTSCGECHNGTACNRTTGECTQSSGNPRCSAGYRGTLCVDACQAGEWGADCPFSCGHCYNGPACDKASGECTLSGVNPRCSAGFNGTHCANPCTNGTYGPDCKERCGFCADGQSGCNTTSGHCPASSNQARCMPGYFTEKCDQACPADKWGADCATSCGQCYKCFYTYNGTACNRTTGECTLSVANPRCSAGYGGTLCVEALKSTGEAGRIAGGIIGTLLILAVVVVVVFVYRRRRRSSASNNKNVGVSTNRAERHYDQSADIDTLENRGREPEDAPVEMNEVDAALAYENPMTTVVSTDEFWEYYHSKKACDGFSAEYAKFPVGLHAKHDVADLPCNKIKSRYRNLVAYDHSRVVLKPSAKNEHSDYINASYINGYEKPKKFIASQGPTDLIINDFMRMLWEQNVGTVVMVTNLVEDTKKKCIQYWPTEGSIQFGVIEVTLLDEELYAHYNIRTLQLSNAMNKPKILKQFHFTAWPDHGAPSDASVLLDFRDKVLEHRRSSPEPIVIHCSAGIGRTGTFIALDYLINQAKEEGVVDVPACVKLLRQQRVNMVQTQVQYEFLHEALAEALKLSNRSIPSVNFATVYSDLCSADPVTGQPKMAAQFKILEEVTPKLDEASYKSARLKENLAKNRNNRILAADQCRPYLSTPVNGCNDYINAVFLPGYRKKRGFVLTQTPLPTTVVDFWRLVYDHGITTIIMLDYVDTRDKGVGIYWTDQKGTFGPFDAEVTDIDQREDFSAWTYQLTFKDETAHQPIKQFRFEKWQKKPSNESIPSFLTLLQSIEVWQRESANAPILVHCRDGASKCGLFCVAWSVLERLKVDQNVNILQTVKHMRNNRPEIITDLDQYRFLHQIVINYLESYQTYANFS